MKGRVVREEVGTFMSDLSYFFQCINWCKNFVWHVNWKRKENRKCKYQFYDRFYFQLKILLHKKQRKDNKQQKEEGKNHNKLKIKE